MPAAIAPDDTITTSEPAFMRASIASASVASLPTSNTPDGVVSAVVPTLTTMLRAVRMASRWVTTHRRALASFAAGGLSLGGPGPIRLLQSHVGAAAGQRQVHACRGLRFPVERHVADGDRAAGFGAKAQQFVFDTEPCQPVAEIADGLVVGEIRLSDPAFGSRAAHDEAAVAVGFDGESALVHRDGADHRPAGHDGRLRLAIRRHHVPQCKRQRPQILLATPSTPRTPANRSGG